MNEEKKIISITFDNRPETLKKNSKNIVSCKTDDRPIHLYFTRKEDLSELDATEELMEKISSMSRKVIMCTSWAELSEKLKLNPKSICFNYKELEHSSENDIVNMVRTMCKLVNLTYEIRICVDVGGNTSYETIKLLQKSSIQGIIPRPCNFGWTECLKGSEAIWAGIPYWPKHIIDQLPRTIKVTQNTSNKNQIQLTARQNQIFDIITTRGASNKHIAKMLNISESTVKLHVGSIFKKYGVKNRTQLAVFSKRAKGTTLTEVLAQ